MTRKKNLTFISFTLLAVFLVIPTFVKDANAAATDPTAATTEDTASPFGKHLQNQSGRQQNYADTPEGYMQMKEDLKVAGEQNRVQLQQQVFERARHMLQNRIASMYSYSEHMSARINASTRLDEDEKQTLLTLVTAFQSKMDDYTTQVADTTTVDELKVVNADINENGRPLVGALRVSYIVLSIHKGEEIVTRLGERAEEVKIHIDKAKEAGADVTAAEASYSKCLENLAAAAAKYSETLSALEGVAEASDPVEALKQVRQMLQEANGYTRAALQNIKESTRYLVDLYGETPWELEA